MEKSYKEYVYDLLKRSDEDPNAKVYQVIYTFLILNERERADKNRLFTITEACEILSISRRTMYRYIKAGTINAVKVGRDWRFTQDEIERLKGNRL